MFQPKWFWRELWKSCKRFKYLIFPKCLLKAKEFKKRYYGIKLEKKSYKFLKKHLKHHKIEFRVPLEKGGDIDIFIPEIKMAIDVKSFRKVDDRIFNNGNLKSYARQKTASYKIVIWLPESKETPPIRIEKGYTIICGWDPMLGYLKNWLL